jgi:Domain of unknown function (DUF4294)
VKKYLFILVVVAVGVLLAPKIYAQRGVNDTLLVSGIEENGKIYPFILLSETDKTAPMMNDEEVRKRYRLRNDIFRVYPYAMAAATVLHDLKRADDSITDRRARKQYMKSIEKKLNECFKQPLKNLTVDQGRILIKLVDRQTGQNCYSIIRELKSGFEAVMWQTAGLFFNDNISKRYDPTGADADIERIVSDIEASNLYRYEVYQQQQLLSKIQKPKQ